MFLPAQIIQKKRDGGALSEAEIRFFVTGFTAGTVPDYQMAALAMAICFQGMDADETMWLTRAMVESGRVVEWPAGRFHADKHSTGGIGDKVSLILAPLVAACGVAVPMISGRGLGPTGGTLDKLESIPGYRTDLSLAELVRVTDQVGCCITGATPEIAPADKKLYALRDVTATVSCLPLIVASILSKKLAANVDGLVLDVKWGSGAFMRSRESSAELARAMVAVGRRCGKAVVALQTDMNQPLGQAIGNALEVQESVACLSAATPPAGAADLMEVVAALGAEMLVLAGVAKNVAAAREILQKKLASGDARAKWEAMVRAQGGDPAAGLPVARHQRVIAARQTGYVQAIACDQIGYATIALGGGRRVAGDAIDAAVGFTEPRKVGDSVRPGEPLMIMHYNDESRAAQAEELVQAAYTIGAEPTRSRSPLIAARFE
jgi:pyrimidine-nucleoside phosphorylase